MKDIYQINSFREIEKIDSQALFTFPRGAVNYYGLRFISHGIKQFNCEARFYLYLGEKKHLVPEITKCNIQNVILDNDFDKKFLPLLSEYNKNYCYIDNLNIINIEINDPHYRKS